MKFSIQREVLLSQLQNVVGAAAKNTTLPIISNFLVSVSDGRLSITATDTEVEIVSSSTVDSCDEDGSVTIPARKLFDIVRGLSPGAMIRVSVKDGRATVSAGKARFTLSTLPAEDFPNGNSSEIVEQVTLPESALVDVLNRTAFAMAQNDVRYYLNGILFDFIGAKLVCVATDGHRLSTRETEVSRESGDRRQIIIPRKGVLELQKMLDRGEGEIHIGISGTSIRVQKGDTVFTSKLIDGRFPDYENVIPKSLDHEVSVNRDALKESLKRASILCNEKYRGVRLSFLDGYIRITAHNPEQEEADEEVEADSNGVNMDIGFNVNYLMELLGAVRSETVRIALRDGTSSVIVTEYGSNDTRHVVMPLRV